MRERKVWKCSLPEQSVFQHTEHYSGKGSCRQAHFRSQSAPAGCVTRSKLLDLFERSVFSFIHSFQKYLLSTYYVLGPVLSPGDTAMNERDKQNI